MKNGAPDLTGKKLEDGTWAHNEVTGELSKKPKPGVSRGSPVMIKLSEDGAFVVGSRSQLEAKRGSHEGVRHVILFQDDSLQKCKAIESAAQRYYLGSQHA
eukprot:CAMPEP_0198219772 /NCGR_PEP_ID=MMETSP1445-20131203/76164_1 /TAXON_ID=36898 /ORGANISM="Pyramimonas sp., Strain CCMP2087" /LENGTH=100 /DNA_ID=CAMNT_0043897309 /DNA_START=274 /DNA_END=573 /DNA_ORIENTATION=+